MGCTVVYGSQSSIEYLKSGVKNLESGVPASQCEAEEGGVSAWSGLTAVKRRQNLPTTEYES